MVDNRLRSVDQLRRLFGLRTLAMLPKLEEPIPATIEDNPVTTEPQSLFTEIARNLASEIEELPHQGTSQRVLVTSPLPGDGKSSVALTLAAAAASMGRRAIVVDLDLRSEEHTSELQSLMRISYAVFCLKKKKTNK